MKIIKSLENRSISSGEIPRKITSQEGGFLNFLRPKADLPLMKSVFTPVAKNVLLLSRLLAGMPAADTAIQKKIYGSEGTTLVISNDQIEDIMKIVKSLEELELLIKRSSETIKNEAKEQKGGVFFLPMLLGTLPSSILGTALTEIGVITAGEGTIRAGENF